MATGKLTERLLTTLQLQAKRSLRPVLYWDKEITGLGVRAAPKGTLSWLFQYEYAKVQRRLTFQATGLDDARKKAGVYRVQVDTGHDPLKAKQSTQAELAAKHQGMSLGDAVNLYLLRRSDTSRTWRQYKAILQVALETLGEGTLLVDVSKSSIRSFYESKQDSGHHGMARYRYAVLGPFFDWCVERDLLTISPMKDLSRPPCLPSRDRILLEGEIVSFWKATYNLGLPWRPFYRLLLLTGQRLNEVAGMQWDELDIVDRTWTIPSSRTKNKKEHTVHLCPLAMDTLQQVGRPGRPYLFTTNMKTQISGFSKVKARLDMEMGATKEWHTHDLRRTCASGMAKLGIQPHIVERVINHLSGAQGGLVAVYQRYEYMQERKEAIEAWGSYLETIVNKA